MPGKLAGFLITFFNYAPEEWISLRTTNIIERLNKEFKRRTKVMEAVAGERAFYNFLAFIYLNMELHWRRSPMGKVLTAMFRPQLLTSLIENLRKIFNTLP